MISKSDIVEAIRVQRERLRKFQSVRRDLLLSFPPLVADYALIISGIRRCGKSTLLAQLSVQEARRLVFKIFRHRQCFYRFIFYGKFVMLVISEYQSMPHLEERQGIQ